MPAKGDNVKGKWWTGLEIICYPTDNHHSLLKNCENPEGIEIWSNFSALVYYPSKKSIIIAVLFNRSIYLICSANNG